MKSLSLIPLLLFSLSVVFTSCKKEGCTDPAALNYNDDAKKDDGSCIYAENHMLLYLYHHIDNNELVLNDIRYTNAAGNEYSVMRVKYYISDITLYDNLGNSWLVEDVHYVDIANSNSLMLDVSGLPNGTYERFEFTFGLSEAHNITDGLPATDANINMVWPEPMGGGYHYMKFEGKYVDTANQTQNFNLHTGRLVKDNHTYINTFKVQMQGLDTEVFRNNLRLKLAMNMNEWFAHPNVYDINQYGSAIMGNPEAQQKLKENGPSVFSLMETAVE